MSQRAEFNVVPHSTLSLQEQEVISEVWRRVRLSFQAISWTTYYYYYIMKSYIVLTTKFIIA